MNSANTAMAAGVMLAESDSLVRPLPSLLDGLGKADCNRLRAIGREKLLEPGQLVWSQGDSQTGIYLIGSGRIRSYYASPTGSPEISSAAPTCSAPGRTCGHRSRSSAAN